MVAASGGNHGAAVAYAAMRLGVPAKIFVPTVASPAKIRRIREYGADLVVGGDRYADALAASEAWGAESGAMAVHAFDQPETLLGQGSVGLELEAQAPALDTVLVAVGGGGLIGGIAAWYAGRVKVVGVEPEGAPTLTQALRAGRPVDARGREHRRRLAGAAPGRRADVSPRPGVRRPGGAGQRCGDPPRPGGALGVAREWWPSPAARRRSPPCSPGDTCRRPGERVGVVLSGANTTAVEFRG